MSELAITINPTVVKEWKRYPVYKDSGVEWLGEVPEGWEVTRVKRHYEIQLGKMLQNAPSSEIDVQVPYLKAVHVCWDDVIISDLPEMWAMSQELNQYGVKDGDLLVCEGGEVGRAGIVHAPPKPCIIQNALHRVRPREKGDVVFLKYALHAISSCGWFDILCNKATIAHFTREKFAELPIPLPPLSEQHTIAAFLDRETARIDALVEKKRRLINLLKEKRQALISRAVTKGLDSSVEMKDSGVEWIGEVPEHWKLTKLVRLTARIGDGLHGTPQYVDESEYHFINGNNLSDGSIKVTSSTRCVKEVEFQKYQLPLNENTILMSINGTIGNVAYYRGESLVLGKSVAYINCDKSLARDFLFFFLQSSAAKEFFQFELTGTTIFNLSLESIRNLSVALPSLNEQIEISSFLEVKIAEFEDLIGCVQREISRFLEYRNALISAAVTGKVDVREEVEAV